MTLKLDNSIPKDPYTKQLCGGPPKKRVYVTFTCFLFGFKSCMYELGFTLSSTSSQLLKMNVNC